MKGKIKSKSGSPKPNSYIIEGDDKKEYFLHYGDIHENEKLLRDHQNLVILEEGDPVEFDTSKGEPKLKAIRVKKI